MECFPGIHRIESRVGTRYLFQHILVGSRIMLIDSGMAQTPQEIIFPYLRSIGRESSRIDYLLVTHPDCDHCGGNAAVREASPHVVMMAPEPDREMIEDPKKLFQDRYELYERDHGIGSDPPVKEWLREAAGVANRVDVGLTGFETLTLAHDWRVQILSTPGHSRGHLSVYDARARVAVIADAALWRGASDLDGKVVAPPTYILPGPYMSSIRLLEALHPKALLTSHYALLEDGAVLDFLNESRDFCQRAERLLLEAVTTASAKEPLSLREIIEVLNPALGPFPQPLDLAYPLYGHLSELRDAGRVEEIRTERPFRYRLAR
jgi:glyoxylase-like metal-dependent hydrolase (beta-lactamase superfamily II)